MADRGFYTIVICRRNAVLGMNGMTIEEELRDSRILLCDAHPEGLGILGSMLADEGMQAVESLGDVERVVAVLKGHGPFDLLILAIDGSRGEPVLAVLKALQSVPPGEMRPQVLVLTEGDCVEVWTEALRLGADDFARRPLRQMEFALRVRNLLRLRRAVDRQRSFDAAVEARVKAQTLELVRASETFVRKLATICEVRDSGTGLHILRIGKYVRVIGEALGLAPETCLLIERAAPLHDVGKIAVREEILLKPGRLSGDEYEQVKEHASAGGELLGDQESQMLRMAATIAAHHHERWDGSGYPNGLRGEEIPVEARITAICDVFDVLTSRRHYKDPWSVQNAVEYLVSEAGRQFDPQLVDIFVRSIERIEHIRETYHDLPERRQG